MILLGIKNIECENFTQIKNIESIKNTNANDVVWFYDKDDLELSISKHCYENKVEYAVYTDNVFKILAYNNYKTKYIFTDSNEIEIQKIAENYLFDSKIISVIATNSKVIGLALAGIDGIIFDRYLFNKEKYTI